MLCSIKTKPDALKPRLAMSEHPKETSRSVANVLVRFPALEDFDNKHRASNSNWFLFGQICTLLNLNNQVNITPEQHSHAMSKALQHRRAVTTTVLEKRRGKEKTSFILTMVLQVQKNLHVFFPRVKCENHWSRPRPWSLWLVRLSVKCLAHWRAGVGEDTQGL